MLSYRIPTLLACLLTATAAAPLTAPTTNSTILHIRDTPVYDNIPPVSEGYCNLLVYSSDVLPLGGTPTSITTTGIAPSEQGNPMIGVMDHLNNIVGGFSDFEPQSPGFAATVSLDPAQIAVPGDIVAEADYIDAATTGWGVRYSYKGIDLDTGNVVRYFETPGGLGSQQVQAFYFPC